MADISIADKTFLVVDDEAFSRAVVAKMLKGLGATQIAQAADGMAALGDLSGGGAGVDCVIADFNMPGMNGLELLRAVRIGAEGAPRDMPVIMLTGNADRDVVGLAIQLDVNAFIVKPGSKATLRDRLNRVFSDRRPVKPVERYKAVDVGAAGAHIASPAAATPVPPAGAGGTAVSFTEVRPGDVLAEDLIINNTPIIQQGARLDESHVEKLRKLADLAEILGPIGELRVHRAA